MGLGSFGLIGRISLSLSLSLPISFHNNNNNNNKKIIINEAIQADFDL